MHPGNIADFGTNIDCLFIYLITCFLLLLVTCFLFLLLIFSFLIYFFSPLGKLAGRAIYFTCVNFFFFLN